MRVPLLPAVVPPALLTLALGGCASPPEPDLWFVAGPEQVTLAGDADHPDGIATWRDRVAGVEAVSGATPDARPRLTPGDGEDGSTIRFGGLLGLETGPIAALETDTFCAYLVGRRRAARPGGSWYLAASYRSGAGSELESRRMWSLHADPEDRLVGAAQSATAGAGPVYCRAPAPDPDDRLEIIELCWTTGDELQLSVDGESRARAGGADAVPEEHTHLYLGTSGNHQHLHGDIAEIRFFGRELTSRERRAVTRDLARGHGIRLSRARPTAVYMVIGCWSVLAVVALWAWGGSRRRST